MSDLSRRVARLERAPQAQPEKPIKQLVIRDATREEAEAAWADPNYGKELWGALPPGGGPITEVIIIPPPSMKDEVEWPELAAVDGEAR